VRIGIDCLSIYKAKYGAKALEKPLVLKTWAGILQDEDRLPADWTRETRVVVGIGQWVVMGWPCASLEPVSQSPTQALHLTA
jgi:hypothetical protein